MPVFSARGRLAVPALFATIAVLGAPLPGGDWPQWRGPGRDGEAPGFALPASFPAALPEAWRAPAGDGYSGPVAAAGKVVVLCRRGEKEWAIGLDAATGKEVWKDGRDAPYKPEDYAKDHGKGPFSTPAIDGGKVYLRGIDGAMSCLDLSTGSVLWRKDFAGQFKKPHPMWGSASSPLIEGKLVIIPVGTEDDGALAALDKGTGEYVWKTAELEPSYSSPVAADLAGARQVLVEREHHAVGAMEARAGAQLHDRPHATPSRPR